MRDHTHLEPGGIRQTKVQVVLPLEDIYVGLHADRDLPDVDRRVLQEELDEIKERLEREEDPKEYERQYQIWATQARVLSHALGVAAPRAELADIVQRDRQVVILGDPGSGKTTLLRYLALRFARAILSDPDRMFQAQSLWDPGSVWRLSDLGPVRLPILLRISHYAEARQRDPDLSLLDYLPRYFAGLQLPDTEHLGPVLKRLLDAGRCIVLLDGLDEIIDPTDRRNIARAIGQFAGAFREMGLPDWLARSLSPIVVDHVGGAEEVIHWDDAVPLDVRGTWEARIRAQRKEPDRGARAMRLAWDLLGEARFAHVGNRFVVTSRVAGYHFAGVPGEFEHYTIRRMSIEDITRMLERWCPAVEARISESSDSIQIDQRAQREIDGIMQAIRTTADVRRLADNPLLLRILAIIHRNEAHLPQRRVELYETATVTLLRDWHLERGTAKEAVIDDVKAMSLLGPLAFYIHENRPSGLLSKGETERILGGILARERGERDTEPFSLETRHAVQQFLETVRQHSGLFVERGEGLYGFMHLTFEEYFTARHLVSSSARAGAQIRQRLHLPRWREPIVLAVGSLSKQFYDDTQDLLRAILDAASPYESVLHRDLLFAAACVGDSVNVAPVLRQEIAQRLLAVYCDPNGSGRYRSLRAQIKEALRTLCNDQGDDAVDAALALALRTATEPGAAEAAIDAIDFIEASSAVVAGALADSSDPRWKARAQRVLNKVRIRRDATDEDTPEFSEGWAWLRNDPTISRLFDVLLRSGWSTAVANATGTTRSPRDSYLFDDLRAIDDTVEAGETRGMSILSRAQGGKAIAPIFSAYVAGVPELAADGAPPPDGAWRDSVRAKLAESMLIAVQATEDQEAYDEILRFMMAADAGTRRSATMCVDADLRSNNAVRRSLALRAYAGRVTTVSAAAHPHVLGMLDGAVDEASLALDALVAGDLPPETLEACWCILRAPAHPLAGAVARRLETAARVPGRQETMDLLDSGCRDEKLRPYALELMHRVTFHASSYVRLLTWLSGDDAPLRHRAALLLSSDASLLTRPLEAIASQRRAASDDAERWRAAGEDDELMRLLSGFWLAGWADALTQLLAHSAAHAYVRNMLPWLSWQETLDDQGSQQCVTWLLAHATTGASLLPLLKQASDDLSDIVGPDRGGPPPREALAAVQSKLERAIGAAAGDPNSGDELTAAALSFLLGAQPDTYRALVEAKLGAVLASDDPGEWLLGLRLSEHHGNRDTSANYLAKAVSRADAPTPLPILGWVEEVLRERDLERPASLHAVAPLLDDPAPSVRRAAAIMVLSRDVPSVLVAALLDATSAVDDRVRMKSQAQLPIVCGRMDTDGSTGAVDLLLDTVLTTSDPQLSTTTETALGALKHVSAECASQWLTGAAGDNDTAARARTALGKINQCSPEVLRLLVGSLEDATMSPAARATIATTLGKILRNIAGGRSEPVIIDALIAATTDPDATVRKNATWSLGWSVAIPAAGTLLALAASDTEVVVRARALVAAGRVLGIVRDRSGFDFSVQALGKWLRSQSTAAYLFDRELKTLMERAEHADDLLEMLEPRIQDPVWASSGISRETLDLARQEWVSRRSRGYGVHDPAAVAKRMTAMYGSVDDDFDRTVDGALAHLYDGEGERPAILGVLFDDDEVRVLRAMLDSLTDSNQWQSGTTTAAGVHERGAKQIAQWVHGHPQHPRAQLIGWMLDDLDTACQDLRTDSDIGGYGDDWPRRRALVAVIAELSEQLTPRVLCADRDLDDVVSLLTVAAVDARSFNSRRFAIRALGNLQQLTSGVADVLFAACADVGEVYAETSTAVSRLKAFGPGSLECLTDAVRDANVTIAHHAALLLGELGLSRSDDLGMDGRTRVAKALVALLDDPLADRPIYGFDASHQAKLVGPLYDVIFDATTRVVAGPDALTSLPEDQPTTTPAKPSTFLDEWLAKRRLANSPAAPPSPA